MDGKPSPSFQQQARTAEVTPLKHGSSSGACCVMQLPDAKLEMQWAPGAARRIQVQLYRQTHLCTLVPCKGEEVCPLFLSHMGSVNDAGLSRLKGLPGGCQTLLPRTGPLCAADGVLQAIVRVRLIRGRRRMQLGLKGQTCPSKDTEVSHFTRPSQDNWNSAPQDNWTRLGMSLVT